MLSYLLSDILLHSNSAAKIQQKIDICKSLYIFIQKKSTRGALLLNKALCANFLYLVVGETALDEEAEAFVFAIGAALVDECAEVGEIFC